MALIRANSGSSGGGNDGYIFSPKISVNASTAPTWSSAPFKATGIYLLVTGSYNGRYWQMYTNTNPSTGDTDNARCWNSSDGSTWTEVTSSGYYFTVTDTSVALGRSVSGASAFDCIFLIK